MTSEPIGALVMLGGEVIGITPVRLVLKRNGTDYVLRIAKEGYVSVDVALRRTFSGALAGNAALGLVAWNPLTFSGLADSPSSRPERIAFTFVFPGVGVAFDLMTGAAYELPKSVRVVLERKETPAH